MVSNHTSVVIPKAHTSPAGVLTNEFVSTCSGAAQPRAALCMPDDSANLATPMSVRSARPSSEMTMFDCHMDMLSKELASSVKDIPPSSRHGRSGLGRGGGESTSHAQSL